MDTTISPDSLLTHKRQVLDAAIMPAHMRMTKHLTILLTLGGLKVSSTSASSNISLSHSLKFLYASSLPLYPFYCWLFSCCCCAFHRVVWYWHILYPGFTGFLQARPPVLPMHLRMAHIHNVS